MNRRRTAVLAATTAVALVATAAPASAGARSCHVLVCNTIEGTGLQVEWVQASLTWNSRFYGHFQITGGGLNVNSGTQSWGSPATWRVNVGRNLPDQALVCVKGWEHINGGYTQRGNACNKVHA